jgi:tetratricopeptide (TPR) repeat protein
VHHSRTSVATAFDVIAIVYALIAVSVVVKLWRNGRASFDSHFTAQDRRLLGAATFYLLVPIAVALHELGHALATWSVGGHVEDFHFMLYWGWVLPARDPAFEPWEMAYTAAAGNAVTLAMGFGAVLWTARRPHTAAWNFVRLELARILLWLTLAIYPAFSLLLGLAGQPAGDFAILQAALNQEMAHAGDVAMAAYGFFAFAVWRRWRGPWRARYVQLTSPEHDRLRAAEERLARNPHDTRAMLQLGRARLAVGQPHETLQTLSSASALAPDDAEIRYFTGLAHLATGEAERASEHLRAAGLLLEGAEPPDAEPSDLRFEVTLTLAGARLALGDPEGAVITAEACRALRPSDARGLLLHADALVAAGRQEEAKGKLEAALERAGSTLAREIRRRLRALPGRAGS